MSLILTYIIMLCKWNKNVSTLVKIWNLSFVVKIKFCFLLTKFRQNVVYLFFSLSKFFKSISQQMIETNYFLLPLWWLVLTYINQRVSIFGLFLHISTLLLRNSLPMAVFRSWRFSKLEYIPCPSNSPREKKVKLIGKPCPVDDLRVVSHPLRKRKSQYNTNILQMLHRWQCVGQLSGANLLKIN